MNKIILIVLLLVTGAATAKETSKRLLVLVNGLPLGEIDRPNCDLREETCQVIPSGAIGQAIGIDRDCGYVNATGLAACLEIDVHPNVEGGVIQILTRWSDPGFRP
jgi:hypothetical protein